MTLFSTNSFYIMISLLVSYIYLYGLSYVISYLYCYISNKEFIYKGDIESDFYKYKTTSNFLQYIVLALFILTFGRKMMR